MPGINEKRSRSSNSLDTSCPMEIDDDYSKVRECDSAGEKGNNSDCQRKKSKKEKERKKERGPRDCSRILKEEDEEDKSSCAPSVNPQHDDILAISSRGTLKKQEQKKDRTRVDHRIHRISAGTSSKEDMMKPIGALRLLNELVEINHHGTDSATKKKNGNSLVQKDTVKVDHLSSKDKENKKSIVPTHPDSLLLKRNYMYEAHESPFECINCGKEQKIIAQNVILRGVQGFCSYCGNSFIAEFV